MYPEKDIELMLLKQVEGVKREHACWRDPERLSRVLGIRLVVSGLGSRAEGAALTNVIAINPAAGVLSRRRFTLYHEITHQLVKRNDKLYSILHDQYRDDVSFDRMCERLCNIGAAEFLVHGRF